MYFWGEKYRNKHGFTDPEEQSSFFIGIKKNARKLHGDLNAQKVIIQIDGSRFCGPRGRGGDVYSNDIIMPVR